MRISGLIEDIGSHLLPAHREPDDTMDLLDTKVLQHGVLSSSMYSVG